MAYTLKTNLANNTVVFIGFSFGDEDFASILNYLCDEMKEFLPHIYVITLDENLHEKKLPRPRPTQGRAPGKKCLRNANGRSERDGRAAAVYADSRLSRCARKTMRNQFAAVSSSFSSGLAP